MFQAADGVELYFEDSGGAGSPLFFVYGLGCSIQHWKYPRSYLAEHTERRQIWMDFRGHGRSQPPLAGQRLTLDIIADDIAALCRQRGVEDAVILGQSMGGTVALSLAARHPELTRALVLLASPGRNPAPFLPVQPVSSLVWRALTGLNRALPESLRLAYKGISRANQNPIGRFVFRELIRSGGFNPELARTEDIEEYIDEVLRVDPKLFFELADDLSRFDVASIGHQVQCPVLVIAGAKDKVVPPDETAYVAKTLPAAELVVVEHGSHCPHFDDPGTVSRLVTEFLERHDL
jgi:pimeloyl-ACP methyl ester carboxylesterase